MRSERSRSKGLRTAGTFLALVFVYLLMAIPFKVMVVIPGFTISASSSEIRIMDFPSFFSEYIN